MKGRLTKAMLIHHLRVPHGSTANATPVEDLRKWSHRDLLKAHDYLLTKGQCSLGVKP